MTVRQPGCGEHPSKGRQHRSERPMGWRLAIVQKNYTASMLRNDPPTMKKGRGVHGLGGW